jgi:hypothetical protein
MYVCIAVERPGIKASQRDTSKLVSMPTKAGHSNPRTGVRVAKGLGSVRPKDTGQRDPRKLVIVTQGGGSVRRKYTGQRDPRKLVIVT